MTIEVDSATVVKSIAMVAAVLVLAVAITLMPIYLSLFPGEGRF